MLTFKTWGGFDKPLILDGISHQLRYYRRNREKCMAQMREYRKRKRVRLSPPPRVPGTLTPFFRCALTKEGLSRAKRLEKLRRYRVKQRAAGLRPDNGQPYVRRVGEDPVKRREYMRLYMKDNRPSRAEVNDGNI